MKKLLKNLNFVNNSNSFIIYKTTLHRFSVTFNKNPAECYYKTLNSSPSSNIEDIKKEYYKLAKKYHPDNYHSNSKENQSVK